MKKIILILVVLCCGSAVPGNAQVSVQVNLGVQPLWGPVGYDYVDYYYMPDIDVYYNVPARRYTYFDGGRWITVSSLPSRYSGYDYYHTHKVVINEPNPWLRHDIYRRDYGRYKGVRDQVVIRDAREPKYYANPRHPHHSQWNGKRGGGPGNSPHRVANPQRVNRGGGPARMHNDRGPARVQGNRGPGQGGSGHGNRGNGGGKGNGNGHGKGGRGGK